MSINEIVQITIRSDSQAVTRRGFGTPLIARYHDVIADRVREYATVQGMLDDGWPIDDPAVQMAQVISAQNPRPPTWKIGKRTNGFLQKVTLEPINMSIGYIYAFDIGHGGDSWPIAYAVQTGDTPAMVATALMSAVTNAGIPDLTASVPTPGILTLAADVAGDLYSYAGVASAPDSLRFANVTNTPGLATGLATDLAAIEDADPGGWYGLLIDSNSPTEVEVAAAFVEARDRIFAYDTSDTAVLDPGVTDDIMSTLQAQALDKSSGWFCQSESLKWLAAGIMGRQLPIDPGGSTWALKTVKSVAVDTHLSVGHRAVIASKNGNVYVLTAGVNITIGGNSASGEWIDVVRFRHWLARRMQERIFGVLANAEKVPYSDLGIDMVRAEILAQLGAGVRAGGLLDDFSVSVPAAADIDTADKKSRTLRHLSFIARLSGAVHRVVIEGEVLI